MRGVGLVFPEASVMDEEKRREKERKKNWGRGGGRYRVRPLV